MAPKRPTGGRGRIDETPVRRATGIIRPESSPGTPPTTTGRKVGGRVIDPVDIGNQIFARRFGRKFGVASASPLDGYISDLISAVLLNQFELEDYYPDDTIAIGWQSANPGAAQVGQVGIFNNVNNAIIGISNNTLGLRLEGMLVGISVAARIALRILTASLGNNQLLTVRDLRANQNVATGGGSPITIDQAVSAGGNTSAGPAFSVFPLPAGVSLWIPIGFVFPPGFGLSVGGPVGQGAAVLDVTFVYRLTQLPKA